MTGRLVSIDALRGAAALWVVAYHLWARANPGVSVQEHPLVPPADAAGWLGLLTAGFGFVGVNLFFVLSGYCIHRPFAGGKPLHAGDFLRRRFWRLYPAYLASIALTLGVYGVVGVVADRNVWLEAAACLGFLHDAYRPAFAFNPVYWSLVYEVQFYLAYPLLLPLIRRRGIVAVLGVCLALEVGLTYYPLPAKAIGLNGLYEWLLGAWVAERHAADNRLSPRLAGLLALTCAALFGWAVAYPPLWPMKDVFAATGFAVALLPLGERPGWPRPTHFLAWVGGWSYSLYLTHVPCFELSAHLCGSAWPGGPLAAAVGWGCWRLFERPFVGGIARPSSEAGQRVSAICTAATGNGGMK